MGYQYKSGPVVLNEPKRMRKRGALFGVHAMEGSRMILVESPLDCLRLWSEGVRGAVSSFGAHVSDEQVRIITERAEAVVIALDNDPAGQRESLRLARRLGKQIPAFLFDYSKAEALPGKKGKDPGELTRASLYRGLASARFFLECG
jgi:DNA primase